MWFIAAYVLTFFGMVLTAGGALQKEPPALYAGIVCLALASAAGVLTYREMKEAALA